MMMTQNKMVSSVTDHHEMAPNARARTHTVNAEAQLRTSGAAYVGGGELKLVWLHVGSLNSTLPTYAAPEVHR